MAARGRWWTMFLAPLLLVACSKENEVTSTNPGAEGVGAQCSGASDPGCGTAGVCVLGYCRHGCITDGECPQGALCLGDAPPYGCSLPDELACSKTDPCKSPLTCGVDGKCRFGCKKDSDCPRSEHMCLAGTCVSRTEPGADQTWLACSGEASVVWSTAVRCRIANGKRVALEVCNTLAPGWVTAKQCLCDDMTMYAGGPRPGQFCTQCELLKQGSALEESCAGPAASCKNDPVCAACVYEKYDSDCDQNKAFQSLSTCGCLDPDTVPPGTSCKECISIYSGCFPESESGSLECGLLFQQYPDDEHLQDNCFACLDDADAAACAYPGVAALFGCPCKPEGKCRVACQQQCSAVSP